MDIIGNWTVEVILRKIDVIKLRTTVQSGRKAIGDIIEVKIKLGEIVEIA